MGDVLSAQKRRHSVSVPGLFVMQLAPHHWVVTACPTDTCIVPIQVAFQALCICSATPCFSIVLKSTTSAYHTVSTSRWMIHVNVHIYCLGVRFDVLKIHASSRYWKRKVNIEDHLTRDSATCVVPWLSLKIHVAHCVECRSRWRQCLFLYFITQEIQCHNWYNNNLTIRF